MVKLFTAFKAQFKMAKCLYKIRIANKPQPYFSNTRAKINERNLSQIGYNLKIWWNALF